MDILAQFGGWLVGLLTIIGTIIYNHRKVQVDESALVLGKWKELVEAHQTQIKTLTDEIDGLRKRLKGVEDDFAEYRRTMEKRLDELETENRGLKRAIAQNSSSTAFQLGRHGGLRSDAMGDEIAKLDRAGDNSIGEGS